MLKLNRWQRVWIFGLVPCILACSLLAVRGQGTSGIRILKLSDSPRFHMGRVQSWRIVYPDMGAKSLTLNYVMSNPGDEFPQHVHDHSDDTFLVLQGQVDVRQGDSRRPLLTGHAAFVPAGQIHGTITTGTGPAILISFQCPPDMALYTGARDSSRPGAAPPKGVITPGAVKLLKFDSQQGFFTYPDMGSKRIAVAYYKLGPAEKFRTSLGENGEEVIFVWRGAMVIKSHEEKYAVREKEAAFILGIHDLDVQNDSASETVIVLAQSPPPHSGWTRKD